MSTNAKIEFKSQQSFIGNYILSFGGKVNLRYIFGNVYNSLFLEKGFNLDENQSERDFCFSKSNYFCEYFHLPFLFGCGCGFGICLFSGLRVQHRKTHEQKLTLKVFPGMVLSKVVLGPFRCV
jgi:hypothetical protein